jgi:Ca2+-binding EF-hand superfamily protein
VLKKTVTDYFREFDVDNSNTLDRYELHDMIKEYFKRNDLTIPIDKDFVDEWFIDLDVDSNGKIDMNEL